MSNPVEELALHALELLFGDGAAVAEVGQAFQVVEGAGGMGEAGAAGRGGGGAVGDHRVGLGGGGPGARLLEKRDCPCSPADSSSRSPAPIIRSNSDWEKVTSLIRSSGISRPNLATTPERKMSRSVVS